MIFTKLVSKMEKLSLAKAIEVSENTIEAITFSPDQEGVVMFSEGLNPCIGILIHGELHYAYPDSEEPVVKSFIVFDHNSGPSKAVIDLITEDPAAKEDVLSDFCTEALVNCISSIEDTLLIPDKKRAKIILQASSLMRCKQIDSANIQEDVAKKIQELLSSPDTLSQLADDEGALSDAILVLDNHYQSTSLEIKERIRQGESDAIHILLNVNPAKGLEIIYHNSFGTLKDALQKRTCSLFKEETGSNKKAKIDNQYSSLRIT